MADDESHDVTAFAAAPEPRRSFLRKASVTVLGAAAGLVGLQRQAAAQTGNYVAYCCNLQYQQICPPNLYDKFCTNKWAWTCCGYVGASLTRVNCQECYSGLCSGVVFLGAC